MPYDNIPPELRKLRQWVMWRAVDIGKRKSVKAPYQANNPILNASVNNPATWATYEEALAAVQDNPIFGLGFVFTENDPYVGIDIDDEAKVAPHYLEAFRLLRQRLLTADSYTELSPSGNGAHIIIRANTPKRGHRPNGVNVELYASGRFFTMTGQVIANKFAINDNQALIDNFMAEFPDASDEDPVFLGETEAMGRRLDLSDDEVMAIAWRMPGFPDRWNGVEIRDWSVEHYRLVGDLDKVTGVPEQVRRLVQSSPFVLAAPAKGGVTRLAKSRRIIMDDLAAVRGVQGSFRFNPMMIEHGRKMWENILAAKAKEAEEQREFNSRWTR